jgi:hypothetical protein
MSAPTLVQTNATNTTSNVGSVTCNFGQIQGQYDTNLVFVKCSVAGDITGVTDTNGNGGAHGYTLIASQTNGSFNLYLYAATLIKVAAAGQNTVTVAFSTTGLAVTVMIYEATQCFVDSSNGGTGAVNPVVFVVSQAINTLIVAGAVGDHSTAPSAGSGFTAQQAGSSGADAFILEDKTISVNGSNGYTALTVGSTVGTIIACALSTYQFLTSGTSYTPLGTGLYTCEVVAPGGASDSHDTGAGGGGGAYSKGTTALTAGLVVPYQVGTAGIVGTQATDTWFNGSALAISDVGAEHGHNGGEFTTWVRGTGGQASNGTGNIIKHSGADGGDGSNGSISGSGGGGGAAGPLGNGQSGGAKLSIAFSGGSGGGGASGGSATGGVTAPNNGTGNGGNGGIAQDGTAGGLGGIGGSAGAGSHGSGGGGADFSDGIAGAGGNGIEWDSAHGCGGGGGGGVTGGFDDGGPGGAYGGGGGGFNATGANNGGGASLIVLTFIPPVPQAQPGPPGGPQISVAAGAGW